MKIKHCQVWPYISPYVVDVRHDIVRLFHDVYLFITQSGINTFHLLGNALPDGRKVIGCTCQYSNLHASQITVDSGNFQFVGTVHTPYLCICILSSDGNIFHHSHDTRKFPVQQEFLSHYICTSIQFPRYRRTNYYSLAFSSTVGFAEAASGKKLHAEHFPEVGICPHSIHFHPIVTVSQRSQRQTGWGKCRTVFHFGHRLHAFFHKCRRRITPIIIAVLFLVVYVHSGKVKTPTAVHFRFQVSIFCLPSNHNSHNHGDSKGRTQYGNRT